MVQGVRHAPEQLFAITGIRMEWAMEDGFFRSKANELKATFEKERIPCRVVF